MRLLWAENHAVFARMAGRQFLSGHDVTVVPSLAAAREALSGGRFDAVLLDYDLDDGKGSELIEYVRALPIRMPIVAASSHDAGNAALLASGADVVCSKMRFAGIASVLSTIVARTVDAEPSAAADAPASGGSG